MGYMVFDDTVIDATKSLNGSALCLGTSTIVLLVFRRKPSHELWISQWSLSLLDNVSLELSIA